MMNVSLFVVQLPNVAIGNMATRMGIRKTKGGGGSLLTE